jgi:hypothetical protein
MITTTLPNWIDRLDRVEYALLTAILWITVLTIILVAERGRRK